jgi:hypothetical protein
MKLPAPRNPAFDIDTRALKSRSAFAAPPHTPGHGPTAGRLPPFRPQRNSFLALPYLPTYYLPSYLKVNNKA